MASDTVTSKLRFSRWELFTHLLQQHTLTLHIKWRRWRRDITFPAWLWPRAWPIYYRAWRGLPRSTSLTVTWE